MSKKVETTWKCGYCMHQMKTVISKPGVIDSVFATRYCEACASKFLIRFTRNGPDKCDWTIIKWNPTEAGIKAKENFILEEKKKQMAEATNK